MEYTLEHLFSKVRLESYKSIEEHNANISFIGRIAPKLLLIEICLRNSIDYRLGGENSNWLYSSQERFIQEAITKENKKGKILNHHQLISKFSFGFWLEVLDKIPNIRVFVDIDKINLSDYCSTNNETINNHKVSNYTKMKIIFSLAHKIRNRAFHAENLYKHNAIRTKFGNNIFSVDSAYIEIFLNDILDLFGVQNLD